jgi:hypothetical protein
MFREDEEKLRAQLGDKYDTFKQELSGISNRAMPMDFGPNSSNQKARDQMVKDRDSLYQRYGVQPTAPSPNVLNKLINGARLNPSVPVTQPVQERPVSRFDIHRPVQRPDLKNNPGRFNELRNRFKK